MMQKQIFLEPHHRKNRPELDDDRERAVRIGKPDNPFRDQQVRGGRHRQELGQPLDDA